MPTMTSYGCSKMAVETVSDILRLELIKHNVSVSVIGASCLALHV
jgi:short-subunit dehydrogenase